MGLKGKEDGEIMAECIIVYGGCCQANLLTSGYITHGRVRAKCRGWQGKQFPLGKSGFQFRQGDLGNTL